MTLLLCFAALLPSLFWDKGPETAGQLKQASITQVAVPPSLEAAWKSQPGFAIRVAEPGSAVKLAAPGVQMRANLASATRSPWVDCNGWQFMRQPAGRYYYPAPGAVSALAAAEAFMYGVEAMVHTDLAGLEPLARMLEFLSRLKNTSLPAVANIGFIDDRTPQAGEVMKLLVRKNLLFRIVTAPDPLLDLTVPFTGASNPAEAAQKIRSDLTDEKRALRIYGSEVVIGRLAGDGRRLRVHLLNYAGASRPVNGLRVRVLGRYPRHELSVSGVPDAALVDYEAGPEATEFTLTAMKSYVVIDLER
ncbi:MAG: hypothetical protein HYR60_20770 [Acidobacteria bacterium]|nr:hypothetical protein [Acidobacteriota bacterium]